MAPFAARPSGVSVLLLALALLVLPLRSSAELPALHLLQSGQQDLLRGEADLAASALQAALHDDPGNGQAHLLLCRVWLSEGLASQAVPECQAALADGLAKDSAAQDWTGRALGAEASHAGMLAGIKLAPQVREAFEAAVALDPNSEAASVDLGEFYTGAPAIVGGGNAKALALAARIERTLPAVAHRIRAMAAERDKDYGTAEREFQSAVAVAHTPGTLVDLAAFYGRRHQEDRATAVAEQTIAADRRFGAAVVEAANVLDDAHQPGLAAEAMREYLLHGDRSDQEPAFRVYTELGSLQAHTGDKLAARDDYQHALALASRYAPARKGLGEL